MSKMNTELHIINKLEELIKELKGLVESRAAHHSYIIKEGLQFAKLNGKIGGRPKIVTAELVNEVKLRRYRGEKAKTTQLDLGIPHATYYHILKHYIQR